MTHEDQNLNDELNDPDDDFDQGPKGKPKFIITYQCQSCGFDFAMSELDKPKCFYCEETKNYTIIKKQELTPEVMAKRMKLVSDRLMENLKGAYDTKPDDVDEEELLQALAKAKKFREKIHGLKLKEPEDEE